MPEDAPESKVAATEGYGARIVRFDRYTADRDALTVELAERAGLTIVHPYDDERVMAGQGTATLELIEDGGELDLLRAPVGGGGLISGAATAATALCPGCRVVGVEPESGDDTKRSLAAGERVVVPIGRTIADGQQVDRPGARTFPVIRERVSAVVTVSDAEIVEAMRFAFERLKLVLEPSGASALAALISGRVEARGRRAGVILFGANGAGKTTLLRILAGLLRPHAGRAAVLGAELPREAHRARGRIGLLGHEPMLYRDLTVRENLRFHARLHGVDRQRAEALVEQVGLAARADDPVRTLSRGMTQRAAICRAVLHSPELLLLDEPLANLDPGGAAAVAPLVGPGTGPARVLISHDAERGLAEADWVLGLRAGRQAIWSRAGDVELGDVRGLYA